MKTNRNLFLMLIAAGFLVAFTGCKKGDSGDSSEDMGVEEATEVAGAPASVRLVHAANAGAVDVYVSDALVASGLRANAYERSRLSLSPGQHIVTLRPAGDTSTELATFNVDLGAGADYTVVVAGNPGSLEVVAAGDNLMSDNGGTVRFIHAVPGANNVDLKTTDGTMVADDVDFLDITDYITLPAGQTRIAIASGSDTLHTAPVPVNDERALTVVIAPDDNGVALINIPERTR